MATNHIPPRAIGPLRLDMRDWFVDKILDKIQQSPGEVPPSLRLVLTKEDVLSTWNIIEKYQENGPQKQSSWDIGKAVWEHYFGNGDPSPQNQPVCSTASTANRKRTFSQAEEASENIATRAFMKKMRHDLKSSKLAIGFSDEAMKILQYIHKEVQENPQAVRQNNTGEYWQCVRHKWNAALRKIELEFPQRSHKWKTWSAGRSCWEYYFGESRPFFVMEPSKDPTKAKPTTKSAAYENPAIHSGPSWLGKYFLWKERNNITAPSQPSDLEAQTENGSCHDISVSSNVMGRIENRPEESLQKYKKKQKINGVEVSLIENNSLNLDQYAGFKDSLQSVAHLSLKAQKQKVDQKNGAKHFKNKPNVVGNNEERSDQVPKEVKAKSQSATQPRKNSQFTNMPSPTQHSTPINSSKASKPAANLPAPGIRDGKKAGKSVSFALKTSNTTLQTNTPTIPRANKQTTTRTMINPLSDTTTHTNSQTKAPTKSISIHPLHHKPSLDPSGNVEMTKPEPENLTQDSHIHPSRRTLMETKVPKKLKKEYARAEKLFWLDLEASLGVNQ